MQYKAERVAESAAPKAASVGNVYIYIEQL